ncbi:transcriptional regulator GlxA family with amidase domain [Nonomuraea rubra]|uniref:Transcriptional regulator GlxA family with amidase domain n=4 Tax=Nonomuraea rubra TaxID=46180 RepID=A0A7X0NNY3_9ACTN|nr:GlxA family transcriptional regulator [Nonomuraea rubra]MBB6546963.1 transcriptional regulator GlxA family with amidase domain [Nonomuraea rubra]
MNGVIDVSGVAGGERGVLFVVYDGVQLMDVAGPADAFASAARMAGGGYRVWLASAGGRDVRTSCGMRMGVDVDVADVAGPVDTLMVAGGLSRRQAMLERELVGHVRRLSHRARRVGAMCTGAFVLAEGGLLDGHHVTTHWRFREELAAAYPAVTVEADAIFVQDPPIVTAAGVSAGVDLALSLIEQDHGAELARQVARWLVVFMQRPGGQSQFSVWQQTQTVRNQALRRLLCDIAADPAADHTVPAMAARLSTSTRNFTRIFSREVGLSPGKYVERARVEAARLLLETTTEGLEVVARHSGFGTAETMRRAFMRQLGIPPSTHRQRSRPIPA